MNEAQINELSSLVPRLSERDASFANSLITNFERWGRLSDRQVPWVHKLIARAKGEDRPNHEVIDASAIVNLFRTASQHLKYPKVKFTAGEHPVAFVQAGERSRYPGTINVSDGGPWGDNIWYGRITPEGVWEKSPHVTPEIERIVKSFAADPKKTAEVYGVRFGHCCFCSRELTDPVSVELGYGPVCADHYGLPH